MIPQKRDVASINSERKFEGISGADWCYFNRATIGLKLIEESIVKIKIDRDKMYEHDGRKYFSLVREIDLPYL